MVKLVSDYVVTSRGGRSDVWRSDLMAQRACRAALVIYAVGEESELLSGTTEIGRASCREKE